MSRVWRFEVAAVLALALGGLGSGWCEDAAADPDRVREGLRVERPIDLAEFLLAPDPAWSRAAIDRVVEAGREQTVRLPEQVPVHIQYWTAWADTDGTVQFRRDLYERDSALAAALAEPPPPPGTPAAN